MLSFQAFVFLGLVFLTYAAWRVFETTVISPLKNIPGPLGAKITQWWLIFADLAGNRTATIHELHNKYGPIVRIGPDEVSVSNVESVKEIYGQATPYMKAPIYSTFIIPPLEGVFHFRDRQAHAQRRKLMAHAFSQAALYDVEPLIMERINKTVEKVHQAKGKAIDVLALFRAFSLDVVGELLLGESFGALEQNKPLQYMEDMDRHFMLCGLKSTFPPFFWLISSLPIRKIQHFFASPSRLKKFGHDAFYRYIERNGRTSKRKDLLRKFLNPPSIDGNDNKNAANHLTDEEIHNEVGNMVFAGTDTTSSTLTYLFWELAQNPTWQTRLRNELQRHKTSNGEKGFAESPPSSPFRSLQDIPILEAVINEGLRMHPAAPASLMRVVPASGGRLADHFIPAGTIVSMQCYTTQRDASVFPNPDVFDPGRWLLEEEEKSPDGFSSKKKTTTAPLTEAQKTLFMPFSKGPRICLGMHLAMMELKLCVAALMAEYEVSVAPGMQAWEMEMKDHFLVVPRGGRCALVFEQVGGS